MSHFFSEERYIYATLGLVAINGNLDVNLTCEEIARN